MPVARADMLLRCRVEIHGAGEKLTNSQMTSFRLRAIWLSLISTALLGACRLAATQLNADAPREILIVPGASEVRTEKKQDGTNQVVYRVHEAFPADGLLTRIRAVVPAPEWQPMPMDWM